MNHTTSPPVLGTLGLKRKKKTLSKWPKILTPTVKEN
jgi:hypothetical protein